MSKSADFELDARIVALAEAEPELPQRVLAERLRTNQSRVARVLARDVTRVRRQPINGNGSVEMTERRATTLATVLEWDQPISEAAIPYGVSLADINYFHDHGFIDREKGGDRSTSPYLYFIRGDKRAKARTLIQQWQQERRLAQTQQPVQPTVSPLARRIGTLAVTLCDQILQESTGDVNGAGELGHALAVDGPLPMFDEARRLPMDHLQRRELGSCEAKILQATATLWQTIASAQRQVSRYYEKLTPQLPAPVGKPEAEELDDPSERFSFVDPETPYRPGATRIRLVMHTLYTDDRNISPEIVATMVGLPVEEVCTIMNRLSPPRGLVLQTITQLQHEGIEPSALAIRQKIGGPLEDLARVLASVRPVAVGDDDESAS